MSVLIYFVGFPSLAVCANIAHTEYLVIYQIIANNFVIYGQECKEKHYLNKGQTISALFNPGDSSEK